MTHLEPAVSLTTMLVLLVGAGAVCDLRTRRIPNLLTVGALALALALRAVLGGGMLVEGVQGAALALAVTFPLFAVRALGGGDVKLLMAAGALLGPAATLVALLLSAVVGWVLALGVVVRRRAVLPVLVSCGELVRYWITAGRAGSMPRLDAPGALAIPYGVAIAVGSLGALML